MSTSPPDQTPAETYDQLSPYLNSDELNILLALDPKSRFASSASEALESELAQKAYIQDLDDGKRRLTGVAGRPFATTSGSGKYTSYRRRLRGRGEDGEGSGEDGEGRRRYYRRRGRGEDGEGSGEDGEGRPMRRRYGGEDGEGRRYYRRRGRGEDGEGSGEDGEGRRRYYRRRGRGEDGEGSGEDGEGAEGGFPVAALASMIPGLLPLVVQGVTGLINLFKKKKGKGSVYPPGMGEDGEGEDGEGEDGEGEDGDGRRVEKIVRRHLARYGGRMLKKEKSIMKKRGKKFWRAIIKHGKGELADIIPQLIDTTPCMARHMAGLAINRMIPRGFQAFVAKGERDGEGEDGEGRRMKKGKKRSRGGFSPASAAATYAKWAALKILDKVPNPKQIKKAISDAMNKYLSKHTGHGYRYGGEDGEGEDGEGLSRYRRGRGEDGDGSRISKKRAAKKGAKPKGLKFRRIYKRKFGRGPVWNKIRNLGKKLLLKVLPSVLSVGKYAVEPTVKFLAGKLGIDEKTTKVISSLVTPIVGAVSSGLSAIDSAMTKEEKKAKKERKRLEEKARMEEEAEVRRLHQREEKERERLEKIAAAEEEKERKRREKEDAKRAKAEQEAEDKAAAEELRDVSKGEGRRFRFSTTSRLRPIGITRPRPRPRLTGRGEDGEGYGSGGEGRRRRIGSVRRMRGYGSGGEDGEGLSPLPRPRLTVRRRGGEDGEGAKPRHPYHVWKDTHPGGTLKDWMLSMKGSGKKK